MLSFSLSSYSFHALLTTLHFRYVNAQFDFRCFDSSATVDENMYIFCLNLFRIDTKVFQAFKERYVTFLLIDSGANPFL